MDVNQTLGLVKDALAKAQNAADLAKSWTQSGSATTGLTAYMLEAPAKTLYPVITPLRNQLPRVGGGTGIQANWRAVTKINANNMFGGVSEGNRGGVLSTTTKEYLAAFRTLGMEDWVSFEADLAAQGFDDVKARAVQGSLQSLMEYEEKVILGGNASVALGTTPTPTVSTTASGGTIAQGTTVYVRCVALSLEGYMAASAGNAVLAQITRTNADSTTDNYGGGAAQASASATQATAGSGGSVHTVNASVTPVTGAVAYAWYAGTTDAPASLFLAGVTTINSIVITAVPTAPAQALPTDLASNDRSTNALIFDGFMYLAAKSNSGAYWQALPTGTVGTGTSLTADGAGGIAEIDTALAWFWANHRLSPNEIWVSAQEMATLRKKALAGVANGAHRFTFNVQQGTITAGSMVRGYLNPYSMAGAQEIPIKLHPNLPSGTMLFLTHQLPYRMSGVDAVARILTRREYYQLEWPLRTRKYEYGVYVDEVLQHYFPPSIGVITNIAAG